MAFYPYKYNVSSEKNFSLFVESLKKYDWLEKSVFKTMKKTQIFEINLYFLLISIFFIPLHKFHQTKNIKFLLSFFLIFFLPLLYTLLLELDKRLCQYF